ncbi:single-strand DNA-binding protein [Deinobacterium chartae]|uniref:Single-stranded DNA-binding protein n=1 Tax=Deinobacterium chartae TaxID=521158 RepID=A0A841HU17_9DEIO|nr:single-stranded DNA-binding protein [Deinobacterium chartae]MBB6096847.1 single-strand DNA-binding protein [Deinobacterium chartae]
MARGMNHTYLIGTLTRDPELRYTAAGVAFTEVTVAGEDHITAHDGTARQLPWYHRVSFSGRPAEAIAEAYRAGASVLIEGSLEYRSWETPDGHKRSAVGIRGARLEGITDAPEPLRDGAGGFRMPGGMNQALLIGNLTQAPELRYTPSGDAVLRLSLAVNESWRDESGQWQTRPHYLEVTLWRELAEQMATLSKGDPIMVAGRVTSESWTDREGARRYATRVEATRAERLTRGPLLTVATSSAAADANAAEASPAPGPQPAPLPPERAKSGSARTGRKSKAAVGGEDLPF